MHYNAELENETKQAGHPEYTVQQALRVKWRVFGVFVCFDLYFVNYRSWQAEILQECAEGCIQGDLQKKIRQT